MENPPEQKVFSLWRTPPYEVELLFAQMMVKKYTQWRRRGYTDKLRAYKYHYELSLQKLKEHEER